MKSIKTESKRLPLQKVFVIGDSISIDYHPYLADLSKGHYEYARKGGLGDALKDLDSARGANGGDSNRVLSYVNGLLNKRDFGFQRLLINCGLHDIKRDPKTGGLQVSIEKYQDNLRAIHQLVHSNGYRLIWITSTPVDDNQHCSHTHSFIRKKHDLENYNSCAASVMEALNVPQIDLYGFTNGLSEKGADLYRDHVHFHADISSKQAEFVHDWIVESLG